MNSQMNKPAGRRIPNPTNRQTVQQPQREQPFAALHHDLIGQSFKRPVAPPVYKPLPSRSIPDGGAGPASPLIQRAKGSPGGQAGGTYGSSGLHYSKAQQQQALE